MAEVFTQVFADLDYLLAVHGHTGSGYRLVGSTRPGRYSARPPAGPLTRTTPPGWPPAWAWRIASSDWTAATVGRSAVRSLYDRQRIACKRSPRWAGGPPYSTNATSSKKRRKISMP